MTIYIPSYTGYVYLWYDTKARFFYLGGHFGKVEDSYICSNKSMKRAYKLRPETFRMRVLEYVVGSTSTLREAEQKWLNKIRDSELMLSENVKNGTCRYYNVKKTANGGSHKGHKKNRTKPAWNKGIRGTINLAARGPRGPRVVRIEKFCQYCNIPMMVLPSSTQKFCSKKCGAKKNKNGGWNKGFTKEQFPQLTGGKRKKSEEII